MYKLVWSENEIEWRKGTFNEFTDSGLFIRTFIGDKLCRKYNYIDSRWVLEKWSASSDPNIPQSERKGTYEPFYVFEDKNGKPLEPTLKVIEFLVNFSRTTVKMTPTERQRLAEDAENQEIKDFIDALDCDPTLNALAMGEGIGYGQNRKGRAR